MKITILAGVVLLSLVPIGSAFAQDNGSGASTCLSRRNARLCHFPNIVDGIPPDCFCTVPPPPPPPECGECEIRRGGKCIPITCAPPG